MSNDPTSPDDVPNDDRDREADGDPEAAGNPRKNALEWSVTIVGGLIVLFVVGFFVYEWVAGASGPADLTVGLGTPSADGLTVEVPVEVKNEGERVAERVLVEVCAGPEACAEVTFDYVPYQSKVSGTVGLAAPLRAPLTTRVVSYVDP